MKDFGRLLWLGVGVVVGGIGVTMMLGQAKPVQAGSNDRYGDYVLCTGAVSTTLRAQTDGVWLLDYKAGKLLGTVVDRGTGKVIGWADLDLVTEFGIPPKQNPHFIMTTGSIAYGQSALYLAETTSGKFGVYTMGSRVGAQGGVQIFKHDQVMFRQVAAAPNGN